MPMTTFHTAEGDALSRAHFPALLVCDDHKGTLGIGDLLAEEEWGVIVEACHTRLVGAPDPDREKTALTWRQVRV